MHPITDLAEELANHKPNRLVTLAETESFVMMGQRIRGEHLFNHVNDHHDEVIYVLRGRLSLRLGDQRHELSAGQTIKFPKGVAHGDLISEEAEILVLEGKE